MFKCHSVVGNGSYVVDVYSHHCTALVILLDKHAVVDADPGKPCFCWGFTISRLIGSAGMELKPKNTCKIKSNL